MKGILNGVTKSQLDILDGDVAVVYFKDHNANGVKVIRFNVGPEAKDIPIDCKVERTVTTSSAYDFRFWLWNYDLNIDFIEIFRKE